MEEMEVDGLKERRDPTNPEPLRGGRIIHELKAYNAIY